MADGSNSLTSMAREAALRNAIVDAALDCIIMMDQDGRVVEFNPAAEKVFGYAREEAVGELLSDLVIPEELRAAHGAGLERYLATGEHHVLNKRVEVTAVNKRGDRLIVELAISPVEFDGRRFFSAYLRDITQAKHAEQRLKASEERFQSLFDLSPDAIVVIDGAANILDVNDRACELAGMSKHEMLQKKAFDFLPKDQLTEAASGLDTARHGDTVQVRVDFLNAKGGRIPTEVLGRRIDTADGPLYHGVVRDVSQRLAEKEKLRSAKDTAERANAAKSDFLANMSHEMRTPLNGVIGPLSIIDRTALDDQSSALISTAVRSAETMLTLVDDLLDLSRIEAGEIDLEMVEFDPNEFEAIISDLFGATARQKGIGLSARVDVPCDRLVADSGKIRQVLLNLVGNAIKFTRRGEVDVRIGYFGSNESGVLTCEVRDTGIGMSKSDQVALFDRFKQADSSRSKAHGGAGLGLAICKELIQKMEGSITVRSAPGVGSVFQFNVPVTGCARRSAPSDDDKTAGRARLSGHVLIAEDSETNAMVAKKMLDRIGLTYDHVCDGAAAVDAALIKAYDLILMDVSMPTLDGLEATRMLRERGFTKPIVAMTAHALKGDRDNALAQGMSAYVTKPIRPEALSNTLSAWLPREAPHDPPELPVGLDANAIDELWGEDRETYAQIADIFLDELAWRLPALETAPADLLEDHAHSLKGAAANVGALRLSELAAELEAAARSGPAPRRETLKAAILRETEKVREGLADQTSEGREYG